MGPVPVGLFDVLGAEEILGRGVSDVEGSNDNEGARLTDGGCVPSTDGDTERLGC